MNEKLIGTLLGVAGVLLWFMPLAHIDLMGVEGYQSGATVGGISYLLVLSSLAYAFLSSIEQQVPRVITASIASVICFIFLVQAGTTVAWGLGLLTLVSLVSLVLALGDNKVKKPLKAG
jgi:hypothetical protein